MQNLQRGNRRKHPLGTRNSEDCVAALPGEGDTAAATVLCQLLANPEAARWGRNGTKASLGESL